MNEANKETLNKLLLGDEEAMAAAEAMVDEANDSIRTTGQITRTNTEAETETEEPAAETVESVEEEEDTEGIELPADSTESVDDGGDWLVYESTEDETEGDPEEVHIYLDDEGVVEQLTEGVLAHEGMRLAIANAVNEALNPVRATLSEVRQAQRQLAEAQETLSTANGNISERISSIEEKSSANEETRRQAYLNDLPRNVVLHTSRQTPTETEEGDDNGSDPKDDGETMADMAQTFADGWGI